MPIQHANLAPPNPTRGPQIAPGVVNARSGKSGLSVVCVLAAPFWPPFRGDAARALHLVRGLRRLGHYVTVVYGFDPDHRDASPEGMARECDRLVVHRPLQEEAPQRGVVGLDAWCPASLVDRVARIVRSERCDVVLVEFTFLSRCLEGIQDPTVVRILDADNLFHRRRESYLAAGLAYDWVLTSADEEMRALRRADVVLAIQEKEFEIMRSEVTDRVVALVPPMVASHDCRSARGETLLVVGNAYDAQIEGLRLFLETAWPKVRAHFPSIQLIVVGNLARSVRAPTDGVVLLGPVDDLIPWYRQSPIVLNPVLCGTGLKIKTAEALALGKCLVTTPAGFEGLESYGDSAVVAPSPELFDQPILSLLGDRARLMRQSEAAFRFGSSYFNPERIIGVLEWILQRSVSARASGFPMPSASPGH
jgi:glycosyltransferase involved in cell wall biosynthesis